MSYKIQHVLGASKDWKQVGIIRQHVHKCGEPHLSKHSRENCTSMSYVELNANLENQACRTFLELLTAKSRLTIDKISSMTASTLA